MVDKQYAKITKLDGCLKNTYIYVTINNWTARKWKDIAHYTFSSKSQIIALSKLPMTRFLIQNEVSEANS